LLPLAHGCASPAPQKPLTPAQRVERDERIGSDLAARFERSLRLRGDKAVRTYLQTVLASLIPATPEAKRPAPRVFIYLPEAGQPWQGFALPIDRVYLPAPFLRVVEFESELAAALAIQAAHLKLEHVIRRLTEQKADAADSTDPKNESLFVYTEEEELAAIDTASELLYRAGYDGRGLVALLQRYQANPTQSPHDPARLGKMVDQARRTIALSSPLRNPIVRSSAFMAIQKRMQKL
jgi:predicted Zn-dependent protease